MIRLSETERDELLAALDLAGNAWERGDFHLDRVYDWLLRRPGPLVTILAAWSENHGQCYDCGLPAAFRVPDAYGNAWERGKDETLGPEHLRCAVCAANAAVMGERITRIEES